MARILAIEADPKRRHELSTLLREHVHASFVIVASVQAAVETIAECAPDVVIAPAWLSPPEEAELVTHMKALDAPYLQMLTVPALDMAIRPPEARRPSVLGSVFSRHHGSPAITFDPRTIAAQIADGLARARELRLDYATRLAFDEATNHRAVEEMSLVPFNQSRLASIEAIAGRGRRLMGDAAADERRRALRKGREDVPWLSGVRLMSGVELELVNISSTGVLLQTGSKFAPGCTTNLQLFGPATNLVVPVRFIRSEVARMDVLGVRYYAAAAFAQALDIDGQGVEPGRAERVAPTRPGALAGLLAAVLSAPSDEPPHARFAEGVRQLVGAKDVRVTFGPPQFPVGQVALNFDVPGHEGSGATLQVVFDRNDDVFAVDFGMLRAAAWLTAAVLEFERPARPAMDGAVALSRVAGRVA